MDGKTGEDYKGHIVVVTGADVYWDNVYTNNPWGNRGKQSYEEFLNGFDTGFLGDDSGMVLHYVSIPIWDDKTWKKWVYILLL